MALRASYEIAVIIILSLIFTPVSAILQNAPSSTVDLLPVSTETIPYSIKFVIPSPNQIHSDQIMDQINGPGGDILFATSFGLSTFNGTWSTRHASLDNISQGLMDDYVTAVEFDQDGNLWIGYSGGIQIYNGLYYQVIRDQQLLKDHESMISSAGMMICGSPRASRVFTVSAMVNGHGSSQCPKTGRVFMKSTV